MGRGNGGDSFTPCPTATCIGLGMAKAAGAQHCQAGLSPGTVFLGSGCALGLGSSGRRGNGGHAALTGSFIVSHLHGSSAAEGPKHIGGVAQLEKTTTPEKSLGMMLEHPVPVPASASTFPARGFALEQFRSLFSCVSLSPPRPFFVSASVIAINIGNGVNLC